MSDLVLSSPQGRYVHDNGDILIEGEVAAFEHFANYLASSMLRETRPFEIPTAGDPRPYDGFLTTLTIEDGDGPVWIMRKDTTLLIRGDLERRRTLAENVRWFARHSAGRGRQLPSDHLHIEWYPEHSFLAPNALPLVLSFATGNC